MGLPDISIITATTNNKLLLDDCIKSIYENNHDMNLEIIVVDNGSTDGTVEFIKGKFADVKFIINERFKGLACSYNQALSIAKGRYVLILNDDIIVLPDTFKRMVEYMDAHDKVGLLGCRLINSDSSLQVSSYTDYPSLWTDFLESTLLSLFIRRLSDNRASYDMFGRQNNQPNIIKTVKHLMGACIIARREIIKEVGMFDENLIPFSFEDTDWCRRIIKTGYDICYFPDACVIHFAGQTTRRIGFFEKIKPIYSNRYNFQKKYAGYLSTIILKIIKCYGLILKIVVYSFLLLVKSNNKNERKKEIRQLSLVLWWHLNGKIR